MIKSLREMSVAIRRKQNTFYKTLYKIGKIIKTFSIPSIKPIHNILYYEWSARTSLWHNFWRVAYYEPLFKSQCVRVGSGFKMHYAGNGTARIAGDLQISLGTNVTIFDNTMFAGLKIYDKPELYIDDNCYIAPLVRIIVAKEVRIGSHCMVGARYITDNTGHSLNVMKRLVSGGGSPSKESVRPVRIGDFCFLGLDTYIYPGVNIGDGVFAYVGAHIRKDIPPFCIVAGNPARIIRKLPIPFELRDIVGEDRYKKYLEAHRELKIEKR